MIEIVAKKANSSKKPPAQRLAHEYAVRELRSGRLMCRPVPSFVNARAIARRFVVQSGYKRAYRVEDVGTRRGYSDLSNATIYYTGLFGCVVADYTTADDEYPVIYVLKADGRHGGSCYPEFDFDD